MSREFTNKLLELMEEGIISSTSIARECLEYMSEDEVKDMCISNDWIEEEVESEDIGDEDTEEITYDIVNWLWEHEVAFKDAVKAFGLKADENEEYSFKGVSVDELVGWISEHKQLSSDFFDTFPELI